MVEITFGDKEEDGGATADGRVSAAEINQIKAVTNANARRLPPVQEFRTLAALTATTFTAPLPDEVRVMGYARPGDGGGTIMHRALALPAHGVFETSADGSIWVPSPGHRADVRIWGFSLGGGNSVAITKAVALMAAIGGIVGIPWGAFDLEADLSFTSRQLVTIEGAGQLATILRKTAAGGGAFVNFTTSSSVIIRGMTLDCRRSVVGDAGHGLRLDRCPGAIALDLNILDWTNSGIIAMDATSEVAFHDFIRVENCTLDGGGNANNGILFACCRDSDIVNCTVKDIGRSGSPCFALQLKTNNLRCRISRSTAINARAGLAIGDDGSTSTYCRIEDCITIGCSQAIRLAYCSYCVVAGVTVDMADAEDLLDPPAAEAAISARFANNNTFTGIVLRNYNYAGKYPITIRSSAAVAIEIDAWNNTVAHDRFILYDDGASASKVTLKAYAGAVPDAFGDWVSYVTVSATNTTQVLLHGGYAQRHTIASGAITLNDRGVSRIILDTEAAAASDDLTTINGGVAGQPLFITPADDARAVVAKAAGGNLTMRGAVDRTMPSRAHGLQVTRGLTAQWIEA